MKVILRFLTGGLLLFLFSPAFNQAIISERLQNELKNNKTGKCCPVLIAFHNQLNTDSLIREFDRYRIPADKRAKTVIRQLHKKAANSQEVLLPHLLSLQKKYPDKIMNIQTYWLINMISLQASPEIINKIAENKHIAQIDLDEGEYCIINPVVQEKKNLKSLNGTEPGLLAINADALWNMGYSGRNTVLYSVDTGVDSFHPAIKDRFLGNYFPLSQCWYGYENAFPYDIANSRHGTHTTGTVLGLDITNNDTIGVAFNAHWMAADPVVSDLTQIKSFSVIMLCFQWALNPDGDTSTVYDIPDAVNNSWGRDYNEEYSGCDIVIKYAFNNLEAAGVAIVFSAGNDGPDSATTGVPAYLAANPVNLFSVGAVNGHDTAFPITSFSSRGPTICGDTGILAIKPEVVAPGYQVRSCQADNSYGELSGTSMAGPHATGAVLLLKEAFPYLPGSEILRALYYSAKDLGNPGEDNVYGRGMMDVEAAFNYLSAANTPVPPVTKARDAAVSEIIQPDIDLFTCDSVFYPVVSIINHGDSVLDSAIISIMYNDSITQDTLWTETLDSGEKDTIYFGPCEFLPGHNEFTVHIAPDSGIREWNTFNNWKTTEFHVPDIVELPYIMDFEEVPLNFSGTYWFTDNPHKNYTWIVDSARGIPESKQAMNINIWNNQLNAGEIDEIYSPVFIVPDTGSVILNFYRSHQNYFSIFNDTVKIYVSVDCGNTFPNLVYSKGGDDLASIPGIATERLVPELLSDWKEDTVDLSQFTGAENIMLKFSVINGGGGDIYIDNIRMKAGKENGITRRQENFPEILVFPNPAENHIQVRCADIKRIRQLTLSNVSGQKLKSINTFRNDSRIIPMDDCKSGIYILKIITDKGLEYHKIVKQ